MKQHLLRILVNAALATIVGVGCSGDSGHAPTGAVPNESTSEPLAASGGTQPPRGPSPVTGGSNVPASSSDAGARGREGGDPEGPGVDGAPGGEPTLDAGTPELADAGGGEQVTDYSQPGAFADATMFENVGPNGNYTMFRPDASLGKDGFKHAVIGWANGIGTVPALYQETLTHIASHGFVIIGSNDPQTEAPAVMAGLDWLVEQNEVDGPLQGKLDVTSEGLVGYSWGGGAVIDASRRPHVKATACMHGMPPRQVDSFEAMHAPLLLFTSTGDTFVSAQGFVTPNYNASKVQTFYATLDDATAGHMYGLDSQGLEGCSDIGKALGFGDCRGAEAERGPVVAWFRLWLNDDQSAREYFYGDDCLLCADPWTMPQRKMWP